MMPRMTPLFNGDAGVRHCVESMLAAAMSRTWLYGSNGTEQPRSIPLHQHRAAGPKCGSTLPRRPSASGLMKRNGCVGSEKLNASTLR